MNWTESYLNIPEFQYECMRMAMRSVRIFGFIKKQHFNAQCSMPIFHGLQKISVTLSHLEIYQYAIWMNVSSRMFVQQKRSGSANSSVVLSDNKKTKIKGNNQIDSDLRTIFFSNLYSASNSMELF